MCSVRGGRSCPLEPHLHRVRPGQPALQETRTRTPRYDTTGTSGPEAPEMTTHHRSRYYARAGTGTTERNCALQARSRKPNSQPPSANQNMSQARGSLRGHNISRRSPKELNASQPDGPDSDPNLMEYSTENTDGQLQTCTRLASCNILELILCGRKLAINTNTTKPHKRTPNFRKS